VQRSGAPFSAQPPPRTAVNSSSFAGRRPRRLRHAVDLDADGDAPLGQPVEVVDGPVDRVDHPAHAGGAVVGGALLAEDPVARAGRPDAVDEQLLAARSAAVTTSVGEDLVSEAPSAAVHRQRERAGPRARSTRAPAARRGRSQAPGSLPWPAGGRCGTRHPVC
jgi:hypothetical protein